MPGQSESLNLRVTPELKQAIVDHAARNGITITAAASVLLTEGLRVVRRREAK